MLATQWCSDSLSGYIRSPFGQPARAVLPPAPGPASTYLEPLERALRYSVVLENSAYLLDMGTVRAHWLVVALALVCKFTSGGTDIASSSPKWRPPVAQFNNFGLVSPFVELLKSPAKRGAAKVRQGVEATPTTEWSQTDDEVVLTIWVQQLDKSTARVLLSITTLSFTGASATGQRYKIEFEKLGGDILPGQANWETKPDSVVVTLPKRSKGVTWTSLSANSHNDVGRHRKSTSSKHSSRRRVEVNSTHKYDVLEAEASEAELGEGRLIARNDKVGSVMTRLFDECSYVGLQSLSP